MLHLIIEDTKIAQCASNMEQGPLWTKAEKEHFKCEALIYCHQQAQFVRQELRVGQNYLGVMDDFIILSKVKCDVKYHRDNTFFVILHRENAKDIIAWDNETNFQKMVHFIKRYCCGSNIWDKYVITERHEEIIQGHHKRGMEMVTIISFPKENFHEVLNIMAVFTLNVQRVFEDVKQYYIVINYVKLQSLGQLLLNGFDLKEIQLVSIIFMLLQQINKYHQKGLTHGNVCLNSLYFNVQSQVLQLFLLFPGHNSEDALSVGQLLFQLTFNQEFDANLLAQMKEKLSRCQTTQFKYLFRASQLDLIEQLIEKCTIRYIVELTVEQALKHHWFINIKQNLRSQKSQHKESLKTIIEMNESITPEFKKQHSIDQCNQ